MAFKYYLLFYFRQETLFIGIDEVGQEKKSKGRKWCLAEYTQYDDTFT